MNLPLRGPATPQRGFHPRRIQENQICELKMIQLNKTPCITDQSSLGATVFTISYSLLKSLSLPLSVSCHSFCSKGKGKTNDSLRKGNLYQALEVSQTCFFFFFFFWQTLTHSLSFFSLFFPFSLEETLVHSARVWSHVDWLTAPFWCWQFSPGLLSRPLLFLRDVNHHSYSVYDNCGASAIGHSVISSHKSRWCLSIILGLPQRWFSHY